MPKGAQFVFGAAPCSPEPHLSLPFTTITTTPSFLLSAISRLGDTLHSLHLYHLLQAFVFVLRLSTPVIDRLSEIYLSHVLQSSLATALPCETTLAPKKI